MCRAFATSVFIFWLSTSAFLLSDVLWGPAAFAAFAADERIPTPDEIDDMPEGGLPDFPSDLPADLPSEASTASKPVPRSAPKTNQQNLPTKRRPIVKPAPRRPLKSVVVKPVSAKPPRAAVKQVVKPVSRPSVERSAPPTRVKAKAAQQKRPPRKRVKKAVSEAADSVDDDDDSEAGDDVDEESPESMMTEERDPIKVKSNARDLAIRVVGMSKITVSKSARKYVPKDFELRLGERLVQDLTAKTYFEPQPIDGVFDLRSRASAMVPVIRKSGFDGLLVFRIGLEEINGYLASVSGRKIRKFKFKYRVGEMDEKNVVSIFAERIVEGLLQAIPYRGFITSSDGATATVNLGSIHGVKEGDILDLFEFRHPHFNSSRRRLIEVQVAKVTGPTESQVKLLPGTSRTTVIEPFAKVRFQLTNRTSPTLPPPVAATDHSVVVGRWWWGFGGELNSFGAEAAAEKYESKVFKINGAPFGYFAGGNDVLTFHAAFGSAKSDNETLNMVDVQGTYALFQMGGAQSAWTFGAGGRVFLIRVTPNPGALSALETTTIVSPLAEARYQYVPRGRIRLFGVGEVFWPIYTNGAAIGALPFAFGMGLGAGMQLAISAKFGFEVAGKVRYLRRPIDGQSGIQERQSMLTTGIVFSF